MKFINFGKKQEKNQQFLTNILRLENGDSKTVILHLSPTLRKLNNSNRIPRSCSGTFFFVGFFSAATRHAGVLSSSRLLRASSGHLFQMLSWPGSFLSMFFLFFWDSIPKRCKGVHCVDLGESFPTILIPTHIFLHNLASIQPLTSPFKFARSPRTDPPGTVR